MPGIECNGALQRSDRILQVQSLAQGVAEIKMYFRGAGIDRERPAKANERNFEASDILERESLIRMCRDVVGRENASMFIGFERLPSGAGGAEVHFRDRYERKPIPAAARSLV